MEVNYSSNTNLIVNILIHVFILFIFLSLFFFYYISNKEQESLNNQVDILCTKVPYILNLIRDRDKYNFIDWKEIRKKSQEEILKDDINVEEYISRNNLKLKYISFFIIISLFVLVLSIYFYSKYILGKRIDISYIIKENIVIFIFIGIIEFLFFKNIASRYVPIFPVEISTTILERIKNNIMNI